MNPEITSSLLTAYPLLYRNLRDQSFECNDGWFDLVRQVSADIESTAQLEGTPKTAEAWPSVGIVKNKFGSLRVQFNGHVSDAIHELADKAGKHSEKICHLCGAFALPMKRINRWEEPLCATCSETSPHTQANPRPLPVWMQEKNSR
jgi:hypothetical protein